jgi:hypothetical protein
MLSPSPLDSISAAFCSLTSARIKDRLPSAVEMSELDGFVIVGDKALQDTATALQRTTHFPIPTLRIMPVKSEQHHPEALLCPVSLAKVHAFCNAFATSKTPSQRADLAGRR